MEHLHTQTKQREIIKYPAARAQISFIYAVMCINPDGLVMGSCLAFALLRLPACRCRFLHRCRTVHSPTNTRIDVI